MADLISATRKAFVSYVPLGFLAILVAILAFLQYRWIGEVSQAEQTTRKEKLEAGLSAISREFNSELSTAAGELVPSDQEVRSLGLLAAYASRYERWQSDATYPMLFRAAGVALPGQGHAPVYLWNRQANRFELAGWPESWRPLQNWVESNGGDRVELRLEDTTLWDIPRFADRPNPQSRTQGPGEVAWLFLDADSLYLAKNVLPPS